MLWFGHDYSSDSSFPQSLFQAFGDYSKCTNYNWYHCQNKNQQIFSFLPRSKYLSLLLLSFFFTHWSTGTSKSTWWQIVFFSLIKTWSSGRDVVICLYRVRQNAIFFSGDTSSQRYTVIALNLLNNLKMHFVKKLLPFHMKWPAEWPNFRERLRQSVDNNGSHLTDLIFKTQWNRMALYVLFENKNTFLFLYFICLLLNLQMCQIILPGPVFQSPREFYVSFSRTDFLV